MLIFHILFCVIGNCSEIGRAQKLTIKRIYLPELAAVAHRFFAVEKHLKTVKRKYF